jgi:hypothetical protein
VRGCVEPRQAPRTFDPAAVGSWDQWPWSLLGLVPEASAAAFGGSPATVVWHFEL